MISTLSTDNLTKILRQNCFEVFDLSLQYKVDHDALNNRYQQLQKQLHPDKYINHPDSSLSIRVSAHINDAYNTLNSPLLKAIALLEQYGVILDLNKDKELPISILMEQMELYEEIEEANHDIDRLNALAKKLSDNIRKLNDKIAQDFESMDSRQPHGWVRGNDIISGNKAQPVTIAKAGVQTPIYNSYVIIIEDIKKLAFYNKIAQQIDDKIEESW
ncbi:MAG: hscB [Burkholderiales bacterium]|jgi:molecular chaperone HscB|nr:hscB [Burkholderiales bacterium]